MKYCHQRFCVSVCSIAYLKNCTMNFTKLSIHVTCDRGSVLFWRQCNMLCTSGFVHQIQVERRTAKARQRPMLYRWTTQPRNSNGGYPLPQCVLIGSVEICLVVARGVGSLDPRPATHLDTHTYSPSCRFLHCLSIWNYTKHILCCSER